MKFSNPNPSLSFPVALFVFAAVIVLAAAYDGNGQPGCKTPEELSPNPKWRNNWDPSAFWECVTLGEAAEPRRCEEVSEKGSEKVAFDALTQECVTWAEWKWSETEAPLSYP